MRTWELQPKPEFESLTLVERPSPKPGPGEVVVRVRAVSLNFRDLNVAKGAAKRKAPIVPASDGAGEVLAVGAGVTRFKGGEKVVANFFPTWLSGALNDFHHANALGGGRDGMLAQEVVLPETALLPIPDGYSFEQAAALPCAGLTAWHALFETSQRVQPGDTVLVQGTGGVSIFALQLAKAAGAKVILTSSAEDKRTRATALGADHVIDYRANPKWGDEAQQWTGGRGVDLVVEVGGPQTFDQSTTALRFGGQMSIIGVLTGLKGEVNTYALIYKALQVRGIYVGSVEMFERFSRALTVNRIAPVIDKTFGFEDAKAAYQYVASGSHFGKVVIRVD